MVILAVEFRELLLKKKKKAFPSFGLSLKPRIVQFLLDLPAKGNATASTPPAGWKDPGRQVEAFSN